MNAATSARGGASAHRPGVSDFRGLSRRIGSRPLGSRRLGSRLLVPAVLAVVTLSVASPVPAAAAGTPGTWAATGAMKTNRGFHAAVLLGDGSVIVAGGGPSTVSWTASAERWMPATGTWSAAPSLPQAAAGQVAVALPNGKALFAGGTSGTAFYLGSDIFDPGTGQWTAAGQMPTAHAYGAGAAVAGGDVIVVGGLQTSTGSTPNVSRYSVSSGTWSAAAPLAGPGRFALTATTLADGRVLVAGGDVGVSGLTSTVATAQIYNPAANSWAAIASMSTPRFDHAAVRLKDGRVLVTGGSDSQGAAIARTEIFDPATGQWSRAGDLIMARYGLTLSLLPDGRVLAAGGLQGSSATTLATAEIYDPSTGGWSVAASMSAVRRYQTATTLADGRILVAGGFGSGDTGLTSAEIYTPPAAPVTYPATTFHPVAPTRILDTRSGLGLSGAFVARTPRWIQVTGLAGVPAGAVAVTGNLTVTRQTTSGFVSIGPVFTAAPASSTLNFPAGDNRANTITVALTTNGRLAAVFMPSGASGSTDLVLDITGYYAADATGTTYKAMAPVRVLDSRTGTGLLGAFSSRVGRHFSVAGVLGIPAAAKAVTGNLTVVNQTSGGYAYVGPSLPSDMTKLNTSTVNAPKGDVRANGVTVQLGAYGWLWAVWAGTTGSTAHLVFDVTGYYVGDGTGAHFVPIDPVRLVDTRYFQGAAGPVRALTPVSPRITGRGGIPVGTTGITGNFTVVGQTQRGYATVSQHLASAIPATSTINFPVGDIRANGFAVSTYSDGTIGLIYVPNPNSGTAQFVLDVTGYFKP